MKGTLYLLDTSVLLALVRGNELGRFIRQKFSLDNPSIRSLISIVSHGEIWAMAERQEARNSFPTTTCGIAAPAKAASASLLTTDRDFLHLHPAYLLANGWSPVPSWVSRSSDQPRIQ
jgi:predicted nucleic acid-binding protein